MNRRDTVLALLALGTASHTSVAEQQSKVWRIGFLGIRSRSTQSSPDVYYDAFVQGLRELGYIEGKNIVIEWRFADGKYQRLPSLAAELVKMNLDLIATHATPGTGALHRATNSIPIVFAAVGDPVARGFAATLAKPGGNMTGTSNIEFDLIEKQVEVMKTIVPRMLRLSILSNPGTAGHPPILRKAHAAALQYGVKILSFEASTLDEVRRAFAAMREGHADGAIVLADALFLLQLRQIVEFSAQYRLPSMFYYHEAVKVGGLISYGQNHTETYRLAAAYVDKILKGAKPGELPVEQPTMILLAINRRTAKTLGLAVPQELLFRANEVID